MSSVAAKAALYIACVACWGVNDILSSGVSMDVFTLALSSAAGQILCAAAFGFVAAFAGGGPPPATLTWPHALIMCANGAAIAAWLAFVFLARIAPASVYMPVVSLYTYVSVLLSVLVLHEGVGLWKGLGLAAAAAAVVAMAWSSDEPPPRVLLTDEHDVSDAHANTNSAPLASTSSAVSAASAAAADRAMAVLVSTAGAAAMPAELHPSQSSQRPAA